MDVRVRVGLNLQGLRRERGLSQEELAHRSDMHQTYLSGIERGRRNPSVLILSRLAAALGADLEDLTRRR
ncbi:helix-turn-helix domain-containing protein [Phenylobacterium sp.]|jgi:transcriptional regulator with XRE-family HTH domain|uniref:helix-turn-helix domain-containing protein n=1 Tax=Phenylobacterium sp. TaxID=1871053 RepID=UPI0037C4F692